MSTSPTAGMTFAISAGVPATFNEAGYDALSYTNVGHVQDYSEFGGEWANSVNKDASMRGAQKRKTSRDAGGFNVTAKLDRSDSGQVLVNTAYLDATGIYAVKFTTQDGTKYFCQVLVNKYTITPGNQDGDLMANIVCAVTASATDVDWVRKLPA